METRDQGLLLGIQIDGVTCFIVGDMSSQTFDPGYISPTVKILYEKKFYHTEIDIKIQRSALKVLAVGAVRRLAQ